MVCSWWITTTIALASRNHDRGFEVQERLFLQIPQPGPYNDGDLANLFNDNEKGLNIVIAGRECILGVGILGLWPLDRMSGLWIVCNTVGSLRDGMLIQRSQWVIVSSLQDFCQVNGKWNTGEGS